MNERKNITHARSKKDGITIFSDKFPLIGVETFLDENENIVSQYVLLKFEDIYDTSEISKRDSAKIIIFDILLIALSWVISIFTNHFGLFNAALIFSIIASRESFRFMRTFLKVKFKESSTARFHAAEHMAINAYNRLQRIPSLDEIKKSSRFAKYCSSQEYLIVQLGIFLILLSVIICYSCNIITYLLVTFGLAIFLLIIRKFKCFHFLQIFFVSKPTDKELTLALECLKQFENLENILDDLIDERDILCLLLNT